MIELHIELGKIKNVFVCDQSPSSLAEINTLVSCKYVNYFIKLRILTAYHIKKCNSAVFDLVSQIICSLHTVVHCPVLDQVESFHHQVDIAHIIQVLRW